MKDQKIAAIESNSEELTTVAATLLDDQQYLKELTEICSAKAKTWDQRSKCRQDELSALTAATAIIKLVRRRLVRLARLGHRDGRQGRQPRGDGLHRVAAVQRRHQVLRRAHRADGQEQGLPRLGERHGPLPDDLLLQDP